MFFGCEQACVAITCTGDSGVNLTFHVPFSFEACITLTSTKDLLFSLKEETEELSCNLI